MNTNSGIHKYCMDVRDIYIYIYCLWLSDNGAKFLITCAYFKHPIGILGSLVIAYDNYRNEENDGDVLRFQSLGKCKIEQF